MKTLTVFALTLLLAASVCAQNTNSSDTTKQGANANTAATRKRPPIFRASKDQIKQTQAILKQRQFYAGDATGKLDDATREGLRKYQQAEGLKVTGTLNAATLEKMNIQLTDKQREVWRQIQASQANANANSK